MTIRREAPADITMQVSNARRHGRVRCVLVESSLGTLVDISASGCRVRLRHRSAVEVGQQVPLKIQGVDGPFEVEIRLAWIRRVGWFRYEAGLEFVNLTGVLRQHLANLARASTISESLGWNEPPRRSA
ncbi:PilZ domain-containing protein [Leptolyngbya sp. 15MV]|nr:PilZ domain-containing protein [Leptolyngbya sp. 15MV]